MNINISIDCHQETSFCWYFYCFEYFIIAQLSFMIAVFYNALINTSAYILLLVLGWKMHRYTIANLQLTGVSSQQRKSAELNCQLNRVLIIQVYIVFIHTKRKIRVLCNNIGFLCARHKATGDY